MHQAKRFRIDTNNIESVMPRLGAYIREFVREQGKPLAIGVAEDKATRSGQQNRRLHKIIGLCADEAGYTIEEMKLTFKTELLEPLEIIKVKGFRVPIYPSTANMKVAELNQFMEGVENLAAAWYNVLLND